MSITTADNPAAPRGFDSPVVSREDDHLNRWPLAREIVGIATTGPKTWSVRVGIYGEWGTGKTSVLRFVDSMASQVGHIVIWFDPWEHSTKHELWQAFVLTVFDHLERKLGDVPGTDQAKRKAWMDKAKGIVGAIAAIANDKAGKAVEAGLNLVKKHFDFSPEDLASLQLILGERRVIILIDDLDRTAPELVPEILFALKELMDIPGFAFVCAFDPIVVGEVLGRYHPGFGTGLEFLDKIIDYPRWLPPASSEALADLSVAEGARSCKYVPEAAVRDAASLLPKNPRAVRQFIRLLTLLKPQIERHYAHELNWSVILAANVLKVCYPRIAHELLAGESLWNAVGMLWAESNPAEKASKLDAAVSERVQSIASCLGLVLEDSDKREIEKSLKVICSQVSSFMGLEPESVSYQVNVAEAPAAVTEKEFDTFLTQWESRQVGTTAKQWITNHAQQVDRSELDVYRELLKAAVQRYAKVLHDADNVSFEAETSRLVDKANALITLLECLAFELGELEGRTKRIGDAELRLLVDKFASFAASGRPAHAQFWARNEALLLNLFDKWGPDAMPLIGLLSPYAGAWSQHFNSKLGGQLYRKLSLLALPKFGCQIIADFREQGFIQRLIHKEEGTFNARCMILDAQGAIWGPLRKDLFQVLTEARSNRSIQTNAYELLHWFVLGREGHAPGDPKAMQTLLSDQAVFDAIWNAAIASPLASRAVYQLRELPKILQPLGIKCEPPAWWQQLVATFTAPAAAPPVATGTAPTTPKEETT